MIWSQQYEEARKLLKKNLEEKRYLHSLGVAWTAASLAMCYGEDKDRAYLAGLLHDCAKNLPEEKRIPLCASHGLPVSPIERENTELLHSKLGAVIAKEVYGIQDPEILSAITWHTTGKPGMTFLEKTIFVADFIEPNRDKARHLDRLRSLAFQDLDRCVYEISSDTIAYLEEKGRTKIDDMTRKTCLYYEQVSEK